MFYVRQKKMRLHKPRQYISYFPNNYLEKTPLVTPQEPKQFDKTFRRNHSRKIKCSFQYERSYYRVIDEGSFYEVKKLFAQELITGLARIDVSQLVLLQINRE